MDEGTLHALDALYLKVFHQNLYFDLMRTRFQLREYVAQSSALAEAPELAPAFRQKYSRLAARIGLLLDELNKMHMELDVGPLSFDEINAMGNPAIGNEVVTKETKLDLVELALTDQEKSTIDRLDDIESNMLGVLNDVGERLATLPQSYVTWRDSAILNVHVLLKILPERKCYELIDPIDFHTLPFLTVRIFSAAPENQGNKGRWPHFLIEDFMPLELVSLIEEVRVEMEVRGEGSASCTKAM